MFFILLLSFKRGYATDIYVSPEGSDKNAGTLKYPFQTLERVKQEILKYAGKQAIHVYLRGGAYYLSNTLNITPAFSGTSKFPVIVEAYKAEKPVISGGSKLKLKWGIYKKGIMMAKVGKDFSTDQLFINGERQHMARYPNFDPTSQYYNGFSEDAFSKERAEKWNNPEGGYIHAMHKALWGDYHYQITGKDEQGNVVYEGGWQNNRQMGMHPKYRYVENIFEELDTPGEWYFSKKDRILYFYPPKGLNLSLALIETVRLKHLLEFNGNKTLPVKYITFKGITFRQSARTFMENKEPLLRSDWTIYRGGAIVFNGAEDCSLQDCFLDQLGGNAVFVNNYNRRITIRGCHIYKSGASGIAFVGDPDAVRSPLFEYNNVQNLESMDKNPGPKTNNYPADCLVSDCLINETGRIEKQTAGVQIEMAERITVRHCSIYDMPRAGINISSGAWGGHLIEYCDVFNTVKETGDHGSFNSWGRDRFWRAKRPEVDEWVKTMPELPFLDVISTNTIQYNRWRCDHGWDIDLDDGSSNYIIRNNLCLNGGLKNREGYGRLVENNIIVNNSFHPHVWYQNSGDIFRKNIVFTPYRPVKMPEKWGIQIDSNILYRPAMQLKTTTVLQKQSMQDKHSLEGDVLFTDPAKGNYNLKKNSPVNTWGFKTIEPGEYGVQKASLKAMAKTPEIPLIFNAIKDQGRAKEVSNWKGAVIRNISGFGEVSAFGLPGETGVLIVGISKESELSKTELQTDDVIVSINDQKIDSVADLIKSTDKNPAKLFKIVIVRNQKEVSLQ